MRPLPTFIGKPASNRFTTEHTETTEKNTRDELTREASLRSLRALWLIPSSGLECPLLHHREQKDHAGGASGKHPRSISYYYFRQMPGLGYALWPGFLQNANFC